MLFGAAPMLAGTDGGKMSKSRGNAIALGATADETAALIRHAQTDSTRLITYDPQRRRGVAGLVQLTAVCLGIAPDDVAAQIGGAGAARLKALATEAVNECLRPIRERRAAFAADRGELRRILRAGNGRATAVADRTLTAVREAMDMIY